MIRIAITDDHLLVIGGLKAMLESNEQFKVLFAVTNGEQLLKALQEQQPDVLLLDIQMPGQSGIELCKIITQQYPYIKVIALTNFEESHYVKQMMRNGAWGYLLKNTDQQSLYRAIDTVIGGQQYIDQQIQKNMMEEMLTGKKRNLHEVLLTKREEEILAMVAKEHTNQEIADTLFISLRTVQTHRLNITQKLGAKNTASLVNEAHKRGLI
ncbi:response regulator containing a CheY-like receiver domain and an HTH DNA-binding domain [Flammeovirgaceae bacterium 311]|nr:response regulator containing a CheY-like receiver domain and an HTH DNA-binding domain [Flammeovirgaceae bacterium 311]